MRIGAVSDEFMEQPVSDELGMQESLDGVVIDGRSRGRLPKSGR